VVEEQVKNFFGASSRYGEDKRFERPFGEINRTLAISRGAALIAQQVIIPVYTCDRNIGYIVAFKNKAGVWEDKDVIVVEKGTNIAELSEPQYSETRVSIQLKTGKLRIFIDDGRPNGIGRTPMALDEKIRDIFPNADDSDNKYYIGFSVDRNLIPTIHIKDKANNTTQTSLNRLLERIAVIEKA
jgi:molecular chaperone DnaK